MNTQRVQLEVLLLTGTSLTSGNLCRRDESRENEHLSDKEKLADACWNGLLQTLLPEICIQPENGGKLYIWQIKEASAFLEMELGEIPPMVDNGSSITPHLFLCSQNFN